jgi:hypothetical protein
MTVKLKTDSKTTDLLKSKNYLVINLEFLHSKKILPIIYIRVVTEKGIPALFDKNLFNIVDNEIGRDYVFSEHNENSIELIPKNMSYKNFWNDFFNLDDKAINIFKERFPIYKDKLFY